MRDQHPTRIEIAKKKLQDIFTMNIALQESSIIQDKRAGVYRITLHRTKRGLFRQVRELFAQGRASSFPVILVTTSNHLVLLHELQQAVSKTVVSTPHLTDTNGQSLSTKNCLLLLVGEMLYSRMRMCQTNVTTYNIMNSMEQVRRKLALFMMSLQVKYLIQADFVIGIR